jgi:hypothetical protein
MVKGSNLTSGVCMANNDKLAEYSPIWFTKIGAQIDYVAYIPRLGF